MAKIKLGVNLLTDPDEMDALTDAETAEQAVWWNKHQNRMDAYPGIGEQLDMQYWDNINGTTVWADTIAKVKTDNSLEAIDVQTGWLGYDAENYNSREEEDAAGMPQRGDDDTDEDIRNGTTSRQ